MTRHLNLDEQADLLSATTQIIADGAITAAKISAVESFNFTLDVTVGGTLIVLGGSNPDPRTYLDLPFGSIRPEYISTYTTDNFIFPNAIVAQTLTILQGPTTLTGDGAQPTLIVNSGDIDLTNHTIRNFRVENRTSAPAPGNPGRIYWDTVLQQLFLDTGTVIEPVGAGAGGGVTGLSADAGPVLSGNVQLISGTGITLTQIGQTITVTATGGGGSLTPANFVTRETPAGVINGVNTVFTLAFMPLAGTEEVYLNGLQQDPGAGNDYTISGQIITFAVAPLLPDKIRVSYIK